MTYATDTMLPPSITITDATPDKTSSNPGPVGSLTPTSSASTSNVASTPRDRAHPSYRLLYRGALSLPDSYLLLDGLAFSARLPDPLTSTSYNSPTHLLSQSDSYARDLMHNPLALALESMRGRPSLRFKGTVRLQDVWMDDVGEFHMDIHPFATLSRVYFENILCLSPLVPATRDAFGPKRTEVGVRVALGDTDGPETTEMIIYGEASTSLCPPQLTPTASSSTSPAPRPLTIRVARLTPAPRAPRPDDPTPRKPPAHLFGGSAVGELGASKRIRPQTTSDKGKGKERAEDDAVRRAREVMLHLPGSKVPANGRAKLKGQSSETALDKTRQKSKDKERPSSGDPVFKIPELPAKARREHGHAGTDVFGAVEPPRALVNGKGKGKARDADIETEESQSLGSIEAANKLLLKKSAVRHLANAGVSRTHAEFKDLFGFVYRGAAFALRAQMKLSHISTHAMDALIEAHVKLYVLAPNGLGLSTSAGGGGSSCRRTNDFDMDVDDLGS
ncbi:hypothetical protein HYDPIDRAFT_166993 [Hydnomerulius pinastri MD-312]|nr:hypothetical protein HYDPIDRAFT_166993 [Hydnomerulius pinastri MD-312]